MNIGWGQSHLIFSSIFSNFNGLDFGFNNKFDSDGNNYFSSLVKLNSYKSDGLYKGYQIERFIVKCNYPNICKDISSFGLTTFHGKYFRFNFLQLSFGLGLGVNYIQNKLSLYLPFHNEISIIIKNKIGLSIGGMVYPFFSDHNKYNIGLIENFDIGMGFGFIINFNFKIFI